MVEFNISLLAMGFLVLFCGILSVKIERFPFASKALIALALGLALGTHGLGLIKPEAWTSGAHHPGSVVEVFCRITMGIALMAIALRLPKNFFQKNKQSMGVILLVLMPLMWLTSSAIIYYTLELSWLPALIAGAAITPTDPVLSSTVVTGKVAEEKLPEKLRHTISAESGANDGLAFPLVLLPVMLLHKDILSAGAEWVERVIVYETAGAIVSGALIGWSFGKGLKFSEERNWMEKTSFLSLTLAVTLLTLGLVELMGMNSVLAVFVCGIFFDQVVSGSERAQEENIQESVNQFFTLPIFAVFGLHLPFEQWSAWGWSSLLLVVLVLFLRRLPALYLLRRAIPILSRRKDAAFAGWFGPVGVAAFYYATFTLKKTGESQVWEVVSLVILSSIVAHGLSEAFLTKRYKP